MQIDLRCPSLMECDLGLGTASKLKQVHVSSKSLRTICWQGFPALADIHLACSGLTTVCRSFPAAASSLSLCTDQAVGETAAATGLVAR